MKNGLEKGYYNVLKNSRVQKDETRAIDGKVGKYSRLAMQTSYSDKT